MNECCEKGDVEDGQENDEAGNTAIVDVPPKLDENDGVTGQGTAKNATKAFTAIEEDAVGLRRCRQPRWGNLQHPPHKAQSPRGS